MNLRVTRVLEDADRRDFLAFPYRLYRGDPHWIPRLWPEQMAWLRRQNSFFDAGDGEWFLARRGNETVGTIGVAIDHNTNRHLGRLWGTFGFFEFVADRQVFAALAERAQSWLRTRGMTHMMGPQSFTPNDFPGFLVGRFDLPPSLYEGHSPPYYLQFAQEAGWSKYQDSIAYRADRFGGPGDAGFKIERLDRIAARVSQNPHYGVRKADLKQFDREFRHVLRIYNVALGNLPGFAPLTEGELFKLAEELMPVLDEEMVIFALVDGQEIGFALALPNVAEAFQRAGGLRHPWHYLALWVGMRRIRSVSFKILAMDPQYWGRGIEVLMYKRLAEVFGRRRYDWVDMSLTGDDNPETNKIAAHMNFQEYKRYRTFQVPIAAP
jgi:GNAT superfamily N-acetyltransferase